MEITYDSMMRFAEAWVAAWNRRDVDAVLTHYADDAQFVSPVAHNVVGLPVLRNKKEIEQYWRAALERIPSLVQARPCLLGRAAARIERRL